MTALRYDPRDLYDPDFEIKVDRSPVPAEVKTDVVRVAYRESIDTLGAFEIELNNWDSARRRYKYSSGPLFDPGKSLDLGMGYSSPKIGVHTMIRGEITALQPSFPDSSYPKVLVLGVNALHKLEREQRTEVYREKKDSQVATTVAGRLGLKVRTDARAKAAEPELPYLIQDNEYDIVFLLRRARANGYDLFLEDDGKTLYFGPTGPLRKPRLEVPYRGTSLAFDASLSILDQVEEVVVRAWNPEGSTRKQQLWSASAKRSGGELTKTFAKRREIVVDRPVESLKEAQTLARAYLDRNAEEMSTGEGRLVGVPALRAGTVLVLEELDRRFGGEWFVTASEHTFDDQGYYTRFQCRKEA